VAIFCDSGSPVDSDLAQTELDERVLGPELLLARAFIAVCAQFYIVLS
jgi:hypothetical protein